MSNGKNKTSNKKFLVIGCGSIGKRHLGNLIELGVNDIIAVDLVESRREEVRKKYNIEVFDNLEIALKNGVNVAVICSPTSFHLENAIMAAQVNCDLFIEKPVSDSLKDTDLLIREIEKRNLVTMVGCNFRFHPGLRKVKSLLIGNKIGKIISSRLQFGQYLPDWHPWEDYRKTYSAQQKLGGGVLLDRIHEIDYARWLFGEVTEVFAVIDHASTLDIETEDIVEMVLIFSNNSIASVHLDYIRRTYDCSLEITGEKGNIKWSFQDKSVRWYEADGKVWHTIEWANYDTNDMYLEEMKHFLKVVERQELSELPVDQAIKVLEIAFAAKKASIERKMIHL
jgi:predicted dehydrogenase